MLTANGSEFWNQTELRLNEVKMKPDANQKEMVFT